jgi:hypothetical protein
MVVELDPFVRLFSSSSGDLVQSRGNNPTKCTICGSQAWLLNHAFVQLAACRGSHLGASGITSESHANRNLGGGGQVDGNRPLLTFAGIDPA